MSKAPFRGNTTVQEVHQVSQLARRSKQLPTSAPAKVAAPTVVRAPAGNASIAASPPLHYAAGALILPEADAGTNGYLSASDWAAFDAKEPPLGAPASDGQVLASTVALARSWVSLPTCVDSETPSGAINGTNTAFTLAHAPSAGSAHVYLGPSTGALQRIAPSQYAITGATLTFTAAPPSGSVLLIDYRY